MNQTRAFFAATLLALSCFVFNSTAKADFVFVDDTTWDEPAVRRVLQTFAYGGHATDQQIQSWAGMSPQIAIREMLTFGVNNPFVSPPQGVTPSGDLEQLRAFLASANPGNLTCPSRFSRFSMTTTQASGRVVLNRTGLQYSWMESVNKRGRNPFLDKVAFWLTNYHMAVTLESAKSTLVMDFYDDITLALENGAPLYEILALGAKSAAIAYQYGHRSNRMTNAGAFLGNDDFARELHQLFFRINGIYEDPTYHEDVTIENTARALTGMQLDRVPGLYGTTRSLDWWTSPIDFSDHVDAAGRQVRNTLRHHGADLEILGTIISGRTAAQKLDLLASLAVFEQESLENLPLAIISYFADDNLTPAKIATIQNAWTGTVGLQNDLLQFLQDYAISTTFHAADSYKYRNAFDRNMLIYNLNTVDNAESYRNSATPRTAMMEQGGELFLPAHAVFGGQTSREAADSPDLFKEAYNSAVNTPNRIGKRSEACKDDTGARLWVWNKDWSIVMPTQGGVTLAGEAARWLWERFIGDGGRNFGPLERAHLAALLATGQDLASTIDPVNPASVDLSVASLADAALDARVAELEAMELTLNAPRLADRREANRRVGLAVNFISATPFMFASSGDSTVASPPPVEPPPVEPPPVEPPPVEPPPVEPPPVEPPPVEPPPVEPPPVEPPPVEPPPVEPPPVEPPPTIPGAGKLELDGTIQEAGENWIVVNGQTVWMTSNTSVKFADKRAPQEFAVGLRAELKGLPNVDGSMTAIKVVVDNER